MRDISFSGICSVPSGATKIARP